jgi:hypothetical protein
MRWLRTGGRSKTTLNCAKTTRPIHALMIVPTLMKKRQPMRLRPDRLQPKFQSARQGRYVFSGMCLQTKTIRLPRLS